MLRFRLAKIVDAKRVPGHRGVGHRGAVTDRFAADSMLTAERR